MTSERPAGAGAAPRRPRREYHTRAGWWLMTHDRGGAAVIGAGALGILAGDLAFAASRWNRSFSRSFSIAFGALLVCLAVAMAMRLGSATGRDRFAARQRQRANNLVLLGMFAAAVVISGVLGGDATGELAGVVAGVAALFAVAGLAALARSH